ncbi:MAG: energy transducer TonB [Deltaproteobacteria bacterium]|nr:energy transducer TonB [Deltaproteobacteria bacterium]
MKKEVLGIPLLFSCAIHLLVLVLLSFVLHQKNFRRKDFLPIALVDLPGSATPPPVQQIEEPKKPPPPPPRGVEKPKEIKLPVKSESAKIAKPAPPLAIPAAQEPSMGNETKTAAPARTETPPSVFPGANVEGGGSAAGAGNLFGKGDLGVVPGSGTPGGGGGTAATGLGRGAGAPGLPAPTAPLRTHREAKPIQSARAVYPAMALRAGLEADVTLKIEVDPNGSVTKAEIIKSGGAGFDEEALKAVKLSRFEPAQKDGQNVAAEFTYIYKFRLQR